MSTLTYAGHTFLLHVDNGVIFRNSYSADGTQLHYETLAGPSTGAAEDVAVHAAEVSPGIFLVGWVESSGMTVTHAMNLKTNTVQAFWTYQAGSDRIGELHTISLEPVSTPA